MSIWASVLGHASMMYHGAGLRAGGLTRLFEKMIIDAEMLQMMAEFLRPLDVDEDSLAFEAAA
jgi:trimethylamine--corrinoid protein Co-methyltransferase